MDIDGVVYRGRDLIPSAKEVHSLVLLVIAIIDLELLQTLRKISGMVSSHPKIPFVFLTNGGGVTEQVRAQELSKMLDVEVRIVIRK